MREAPLPGEQEWIEALDFRVLGPLTVPGPAARRSTSVRYARKAATAARARLAYDEAVEFLQ